MTTHAEAIKELQLIHDGIKEETSLGPSERDTRQMESLMLAIDALRSPSPAQGMYSVEDIEAWHEAECNRLATPFDKRAPYVGIAAWKAAQLAGKEKWDEH